jgi:hypothetical protein
MSETRTTVGAEIIIDGKKAEQSLGSIRERLKEAKTQLTDAIENFGEFSKEAANAAKKVEGLKGTIDDAGKLVAAFDGDRKFTAFGQSVSAVASGFTAVQGAIGLFGTESKEVEEVLLKVNSAMALSQGIDGVLEGVKSFKQLRQVLLSYSIVQKAATVAQTIFNAVMAANPIGLLIVAITALIAGVVALTSYFMSNAKANRENAKAVEDNTKALKKQQEANKIANDELARGQAFQLAMAKANGASTKAIRALELKLIDEKIATEQLSRETANNTLVKNANALATLKQTGASDDLIEKQQQVVNESVKFANEQTANLRKSFVDREELQRKHLVEIATENTTANTNAIAKGKENEQKAKEAREAANQKAIDDLKNKNQTELEIAKIAGQDTVVLRAAQIEAEIALIKSKGPKFIEQVKALENEKRIAAATALADGERASFEALKTKNEEELKLAKLAGEDTFVLRAKQIDDEILLLQSKSGNFKEAIATLEREKVEVGAQAEADAKAKADEKKKLRDDLIKDLQKESKKTELAALQEDFNAEYALLEGNEEARKLLVEKYAKDKAGIEKKYADEELRIEQEKFDLKKKLLDATSNALTVASDIVGRETATGKALAVAASLINTYSAIAGQLKAFSGVPVPGYAIVQAVATGAAGLAAVRNILKTKVPGRSSGAGGGVSVPTNITAPVAPQADSTRLDPTQVNQIGNAASRAFVVESDITGNQDKIRRLNRQARIN